MRSKIYTIVSLSVIGLVVLATASIIILNGAKNRGFNYVRLDYNPSIEFVTDTSDKVVAYRPLNDTAKLSIAGLDLKGEEISVAINKVMDESLKMGYFDLKKEYIPIKLTAISGLTESFDIEVYRAVNDFLVDNQIMGVIVENENDMSKLQEARKLKVTVNELALIDSISESNRVPKEMLTSKMPDELIDIVRDIDEEYMMKCQTQDNELIEKDIMKKEFEQEYTSHIESVSNKNKREYMEKRNEIIKARRRELELNFEIN